MGRNGKLSNVYLAVVFAILYAPIAYLIFYSFNSGGHMRGFEGFTLEWYREVFADTRSSHYCLEYVYYCVVVLSDLNHSGCGRGTGDLSCTSQTDQKHTVISKQRVDC